MFCQGKNEISSGERKVFWGGVGFFILLETVAELLGFCLTGNKTSGDVLKKLELPNTGDNHFQSQKYHTFSQQGSPPPEDADGSLQLNFATSRVATRGIGLEVKLKPQDGRLGEQRI